MLRIALCRFVIGLALAAALLGLGVYVVQATAPAETPAAQTGPLTDPGKLVVAAAPPYDEVVLRGLVARQGGAVERWLPGLGLALASVPPGAEAVTAAALEASPDVDFVTEHSRSVRIADVPLDQHFPQQWGMVQVGGPQAWNIAWGDSGTVIAVVDTGVNNLHEDLRRQAWINVGETIIDPVTGLRICDNNGIDDDLNDYIDDCRGWNFVDWNTNPNDGHGHGTAVTGIAAASTNNYHATLGLYTGVAGMARGARYMPLRALDDSGAGYPLDVAQAIEYAADMGAAVVNLSLVLNTPNPDPAMVDIFRRGVEYAQAREVLVVGVSGNAGYGMVYYPAALPGVLAVGASTEVDTRATFSNFGDRLDMVAPGVGIFTTLRQPGNIGYGLFNGNGNGTSFAGPHAAGVVALVRGLRPDLGEAAVRGLITSTVADVGGVGFDPETGWGRLDAYAAVLAATSSLSLSLSADPPTVPGGGQTTLSVQVVAPGGAAAGLGGRVAFSSTLGVVAPATATVDGTGRATTTFTAPVGATQAVITATLGQATAALAVSLTSGLPTTVAVSAAPARIASEGGQATITATVRDEGGSLVADGVTVTFTTTLGTISPLQAATIRGRATTVLTSGALTGTAHVWATTQGITGATAVEIVGAGEPFAVVLAAEPAAAAVGGAPAAITATVLDGVGAPVPNGIIVHFTSTLGVISQADRPTVGGQASTLLAPGTQAGKALIGARAGAAAATLELSILPGAAATATLSAEPAVLTAGYNQIAMLRAEAVDRFGNPVGDGTPLVFASSLGMVTPATVTTAGGRGQTSFLAEFVAGTSRITVTVGATAVATTTVLIRPAQPVSLTLAPDPATVQVGGQAVAMTAVVRDAYGNLADSALAILTTDRGGLRLSGTSTTALSLTVPFVGGIARAELVPGTVAGVAHVRASTAPSLLALADVVIQPGPPAAPITLTVQPSRVGVGGRARLTVEIRDGYGNPVADGTMAHFAASRGVLSPVDAPAQGGLATAILATDAQLGVVTIVAVSGGISAFGSLDVVPAEIYLPIVLRQ